MNIFQINNENKKKYKCSNWPLLTSMQVSHRLTMLCRTIESTCSILDDPIRKLKIFNQLFHYFYGGSSGNSKEKSEVAMQRAIDSASRIYFGWFDKNWKCFHSVAHYFYGGCQESSKKKSKRLNPGSEVAMRRVPLHSFRGQVYILDDSTRIENFFSQLLHCFYGGLQETSKKKSKGVRYGVRGGHATGSPLPTSIQDKLHSGNFLFLGENEQVYRHVK